MSDINQLVNGDLEADWSEQQSHACIEYPGAITKEIGNIFVPPGYKVWFYHDGIFAQPEGRDARAKDPDRMRTGTKGYLLFNSFRRHDCGLMQTVTVSSGAIYTLSGWAHAWSNHQDLNHPGQFPRPDDARWSEGAGFEQVGWLLGTQDKTGQPQQDARSNFVFWLGVDPRGGINPYSADVIWTPGYHIYNGYVQQLALEFEARAAEITIFTRQKTDYGFKHNDGYWDDLALFSVEDTPLPPEQDYPRLDYTRVVWLIHPRASRTQINALVDQAIPLGRSIEWSVDDAMMGPRLTDKTAVFFGYNATEQTALIGFRDEYYPGCKVEFKPLPGEEPEPPLPPPLAQKITTLHVQTEQPKWLDAIAAIQPAWFKCFSYELAGRVKAASPQTRVLVRHHLQHHAPYVLDPDPAAAANRYLNLFWEAVKQNPAVDAIEGLNETIASGDTEYIKRVVEFEMAVMREVRRRSDRVAVVSPNTAVGNPHWWEIIYLLPLAQLAAELEHKISYHAYYPVAGFEKGKEWLENEWLYHHGRALGEGNPDRPGWYEVFEQHMALKDLPGLLFTEGGPVYMSPRPEDGRPGAYDGGAGWRDPRVLNSNFDQYLTLQRRFEQKCKAHRYASKIEAYSLFTTGDPNIIGWDKFVLRQAEHEALEGF